ncbi:hypothetical protein ACFL96_18220 [Thermoproteota archaeon]
MVKLPKIKKEVKKFFLDETGKTTKTAIVKAGAIAAAISMMSQQAAAEHCNTTYEDDAARCHANEDCSIGNLNPYRIIIPDSTFKSDLICPENAEQRAKDVNLACKCPGAPHTHANTTTPVSDPTDSHANETHANTTNYHSYDSAKAMCDGDDPPDEWTPINTGHCNSVTADFCGAPNPDRPFAVDVFWDSHASGSWGGHGNIILDEKLCAHCSLGLHSNSIVPKAASNTITVEHSHSTETWEENEACDHADR